MAMEEKSLLFSSTNKKRAKTGSVHVNGKGEEIITVCSSTNNNSTIT